MSTTENGWTDQYPHKVDAGDEYYFVRRRDRKDVVIMGFSMGKAWLNGVSYEQSEMRTHLFLGPLRPEDFEQLAALRKLIVHMHVHSGYPNNGYMQMTTPQKELYDAIWKRSVAELDAEDELAQGEKS